MHRPRGHPPPGRGKQREKERAKKREKERKNQSTGRGGTTRGLFNAN